MPIDPNSSWLPPAVQKMSTRGLSVEGAKEWAQGVVPQSANDRLRISNNLAETLKGAGGNLKGQVGGFSPSKILSGKVEKKVLDFGKKQVDDLKARAFDFGGNPISFGDQKEKLVGKGKELLGHELSHVVQQGSGLAKKGKEALGGLKSALNF